MKLTCIFLIVLFACAGMQGQTLVSNTPISASFAITQRDSLYIYTDKQDDWLIQKAAVLLQTDIEKVTGNKPILVHEAPAGSAMQIIIGSIHGSAVIQQLAAANSINIKNLEGKWEAGQWQALEGNSKGRVNRLVIAGSDKRGTAFGVFELSRQLGVSPWYWWADVPVKTKKAVYIKKGVYPFSSPSVQYRGIFINDEAPAFSGWTKEKFGGVNHLVYEKIFELLLRLKANYLWPAMWGNAFNDDDTLNPILADKWGIVMGTSHHEPMLRAQTEWKRYGKGAWDYTKNDTTLRAFWKKGIENMGQHESIVTIGMRGDGDMPMTQGTATSLLEKIVADQRTIIEEVTRKPAAQTPQLWALYKEVQDYYDKGMRVPDDITLLLCDDNWGNIRRLPKPADTSRSGGFGIYYHFDYVGGPRNYKWINTNNISRVWEQMHLAHAYGANKIWIVNVGDLKPMELPISFFLEYAFNCNRWNEGNITGFYRTWATEQFGTAHAAATASLLSRYAVYAARRKPELLDANTYNLASAEFARVLQEWTRLRQDAETLDQQLSPDYKDAFFELVLHPILAMENLHQLYYAVAMNRQLAKEQNSAANAFADKAKQYYQADSLLSARYNKELAGGKWNHMMDQTHIGYTYWQEPRRNNMPAVSYVSGGNDMQPVNIVKNAIAQPLKKPVNGVYHERDGYCSMNAAGFNVAHATHSIQWKRIAGIGKNGDGISSFPVTAAVVLDSTSPCLQYHVITSSKDSLQISWYFSPTLNFLNAPEGLRFAVSVDDDEPQVMALNKDDNGPAWNNWVASNTIIKTSLHYIAKPGKHIIKYWLVDPGIVLQHIVGRFRPAAALTYLAPPVTY